MSQSKSQYKIAILPAILTIVVLVEVGFYFSRAGLFDRNVDDIQRNQKKLGRLTSDPKKAPNATKLKTLKAYQNNLQSILGKLTYTFESVTNHEPPLKALEFKAKLKSLEEEYGKYRIPIQSGLGFKEFYGAALPSEDRLKTLSRQLSLITQVIQLLIDNNVEEISEIKRFSPHTLKGTMETKELFTVYPVAFSFKVYHSNLIAFLSILNSDPSLIKVKSMNIKSNYSERDKNSLQAQLVSVDLTLTLTEWMK